MDIQTRAMRIFLPRRWASKGAEVETEKRTGLKTAEKVGFCG